jgi:iron complex outermembrane receptor protein
MERRGTKYCALITCSALASVFAASAHAQQAAGPASAYQSPNAEVVVTAQKQTQALDKVPLPVSAFSGRQLTDRNYLSIDDFNGAVPGLSVATYGGEPLIEIRGIGNTQQEAGNVPAVAFYEDGVYLPRPQDEGTAFFDVQRLEFVRGPVGTVYGENATAGAINVITNLPTDVFNASAQVTVGNYDTVDTRAVISGPASDNLFLRLAVATDNHSGYSLNIFNHKYYDDENTQSVRGTMVYQPTSRLTFTTIVDWHGEDDGSNATHYLGSAVPGVPLVGITAGGTSIPINANGDAINPRLLDNDSLPLYQQTSAGISEEGLWTISPSISAKSITAFRYFNYFMGGEFDATDWPFPSDDHPGYNYIEDGTSNTWTEELQLLGHTDRLDWVGGLFFLDDHVNGGYDFGFDPAPRHFGLLAGGTLDTVSEAVYGQVTYRPVPQLGLTVGVRYGDSNASVDSTWVSFGQILSFFGPCLNLPNDLCLQKTSTRTDKIIPKLGADYQWSDNLMTYVNISEGYKDGGFGIADLAPAYNPETVWNFEGGFKVHSSDNRWSADADAFYYDYADLQVSQINNGIIEINNAAQSRVYGAEIEAVANPVVGLTVTDSFAYTDAIFTKFLSTDPAFPNLGAQNVAGKELPYAARFTNNLLVSYEFPFMGAKLRLSGEWNYRDKVYFSQYNTADDSQPAVSTFNASARYTSSDGRWYFELFGKNLTNEVVIIQENISSATLGFPRNGVLAPPRTFGATLSYRY